ncbi:hypothetical protein SCBWM1_gp104 [Synechococcus phage S-CBWM1]|uniref:Uncharacterized protein n=1 Tax=Synechococcus phage S-CBWM1 TaxID=2053653 RepID=A0A3G1L3N4_9CAUD|nr:hypothetical protein HOU61_gp093 [Synechococcus phage S-CBWM1]ATW62788.1 hypothetical protein SCBWM1_gp104 [Synechococcus phage S-CBWM1]
MANSITDTVPEMMRKDHGTVVLISDPRAERYLWQSRKRRENEKHTPNFIERLTD